MDIWIAYYEDGQYSDYSMGILGVAATADLAKAICQQDTDARLKESATYLRGHIEKRGKDANQFAHSDVLRYRHQLAQLPVAVDFTWKPDEDDEGKWHAVTFVNGMPTASYSMDQYTVARYTLVEGQK